MRKEERQEIIEEIIENNVIRKQEEIVSALAEYGLKVTQATISRDIREMQLVKIPTESGDSHYSLPEDSTDKAYRQIKKIVSDSFVSIDIQRDMLYLKTISGSGDAVANAISQQDIEQIFALVSNDNSVLIICKSVEAAKKMRERIVNLI